MILSYTILSQCTQGRLPPLMVECVPPHPSTTLTPDQCLPLRPGTLHCSHSTLCSENEWVYIIVWCVLALFTKPYAGADPGILKRGQFEENFY